jgi:Ca-activated chloride channel family protein
MRTKRLFLFVLLFAVTLSQQALSTGALFVRPLNSNQTYELINIKTFDATATIEDQIATTHIDQLFFNNTNSVVEATFIFPLPETAIITELIYWFNGKKYIANLRERQSAQNAYNEKIRQRIDPALLQDIGNNIFKLNIAPINPKSDIRFEITYSELLPYEFGKTEYKFFLNTTSLSPVPLERVSLKVNAKTSTSFVNFDSPSHENTAESSIQQITPSNYTVTYGDENFMPTKDYLIRFETSRANISMNAITYVPTPADSMGTDKFFAFWVTPPDNSNNTSLPRNICFSADISSSMEGKQLENLKKSMHTFLDGLASEDRFNIIPFSTNIIKFKSDLVQANAENIAEARKFIDKLGAAGLTNMDDALSASLKMSYDSTASKILVFITDGFPSWGEMNEAKIMSNVKTNNIHDVRIFPFGVGDSVNKKFMVSLGQENGGYATFVKQTDSIGVIINDYFKRISRPVLTDLMLDYGGLNSYDIYEQELQDLFWGSQVLQFGRYKTGGVFPVKLTGKVLKDDFTLEQNITFRDEAGGNKAVARLWAKRKIDFLLNEIVKYGEKKELVDAIIDLSIRYGVLSPYTALYSDPDEDEETTDIQENIVTENGLTVKPSYPNPFSIITRISFTVPEDLADRKVALKIYDVFGRIVKVVFEGNISAGQHEFVWDGRNDSGELQPNGVYVYRLEADSTVLSNTIVIER